MKSENTKCNNMCMPIRVLEVYRQMGRGGAETMMMNLYRRMDKSIVQLDFVVHSSEFGCFSKEIEQLGGRIFFVPQFKIFNIIVYINVWRKLLRSHPEWKIVHGHIGFPAAIYLLIAKRYGRFTIAHSHSVGPPEINIHNILYKLFSWPTRYVANHFFGCSTEAGIARYGDRIANSPLYENMPNAINLEDFSFCLSVRNEVRRELGLQPNQLCIIHVGRITSAKNPSMLLAIFKAIVEHNPHAQCLWVGTGELEPIYRKEIERTGYQDRIRMTGSRSDIPRLLMAADCFLFPSLWEGLPVSVIEAQATGLPCVISDTISKEVKVSDLVEWHSLSENANLWASRCLCLAGKYYSNRCSPIAGIRSAGYDINESVDRLTNFYVKQTLKLLNN